MCVCVSQDLLLCSKLFQHCCLVLRLVLSRLYSNQNHRNLLWGSYSSLWQLSLNLSSWQRNGISASQAQPTWVARSVSFFFSLHFCLWQVLHGQVTSSAELVGAVSPTSRAFSFGRKHIHEQVSVRMVAHHSLKPLPTGGPQ